MQKFNQSTDYYIIKEGELKDLSLEFDKLVNYLGTLADFKIKVRGNKATISYPKSSTQSFLTNKIKKYSDTTISPQITFTCEKKDGETIRFLNSAIKNYGFRIFNPKTHSFLVNDDNLTDLSTINIEPELINIFNAYGLAPLFKYQNSMVYYAKELKGESIHLVNRHLLEFLLKNSDKTKKQESFSVKVADNISTFIALFDRGLIPISFYPYYFSPENIINYSGFNTTSLKLDVIITPVFFELVLSRQTFRPLKNIPYLGETTIKKGFSISSYLNQITKNPFFKGKILSTKVAADVSYEFIKKGLIIPRLTLSIFLDEQSN